MPLGYPSLFLHFPLNVLKFHFGLLVEPPLSTARARFLVAVGSSGVLEVSCPFLEDFILNGSDIILAFIATYLGAHIFVSGR